MCIGLHRKRLEAPLVEMALPDILAVFPPAPHVRAADPLNKLGPGKRVGNRLTHGRLSDSMWSMSRKPRRCPGGLAYHVMNRATARETIFAGDGDYAAFERVLAEAREREAGRIRVCAYALMPNHFHLVLWPQSGEDEAVSGLMKWLTLTHAQRWHAHRHTAGTGALYGSRFKSFPVREDWHFLKVCRYVERNPLRANPFDKLRAGSG